MNPREFYKKYYPYARESEQKTGVPALFSLGQSAIENGWGEHMPGNMMFGIKDTDGVNGNEQLLWTTEYSRRTGKWTRIKAWFRRYQSPEASFTDHGRFLRDNRRYMNAFQFTDPYIFATRIAAAGYATDPRYLEKVAKAMRMMEGLPV